MGHANVLTAKFVETANAGEVRREIPDAALPGLYLVVQPSGGKSWALRYRHQNKPKKLTLGPVLLKRDGDAVDGVVPIGQSMTLVEARRAARDSLQILAEGIDPGEKKKATTAARAADGLSSTNRHQPPSLLLGGRTH